MQADVLPGDAEAAAAVRALYAACGMPAPHVLVMGRTEWDSLSPDMDKILDGSGRRRWRAALNPLASGWERGVSSRIRIALNLLAAAFPAILYPSWLAHVLVAATMFAAWHAQPSSFRRVGEAPGRTTFGSLVRCACCALAGVAIHDAGSAAVFAGVDFGTATGCIALLGGFAVLAAEATQGLARVLRDAMRDYPIAKLRREFSAIGLATARGTLMPRKMRASLEAMASECQAAGYPDPGLDFFRPLRRSDVFRLCKWNRGRAPGTTPVLLGKVASLFWSCDDFHLTDVVAVLVRSAHEGRAGVAYRPEPGSLPLPLPRASRFAHYVARWAHLDIRKVFRKRPQPAPALSPFGLVDFPEPYIVEGTALMQAQARALGFTMLSVPDQAGLRGPNAGADAMPMRNLSPPFGSSSLASTLGADPPGVRNEWQSLVDTRDPEGRNPPPAPRLLD